MSISRRGFLIASTAVTGGIIIGVTLPGIVRNPHANTRLGSFQPNAWLQITSDNQIIFQLDKVEMGQGVMTTLPTILAEELEIHPNQLTVEFAKIHPTFRNAQYLTMLTAASNSISTSYRPLLEAGAVAREMLLAAAASIWQVPVTTLKIVEGCVVGDTHQGRLSFGELANVASKVGVPRHVELKDPKQYRWLGHSSIRRDAEDKVTGKAVYGIDVTIPEARSAILIRCPHFGGKITRFNAEQTSSQPGVDAVFPLLDNSALAIVADTYWHARQAANSAKVEWDKGPLKHVSSASILAEQEQIAKEVEPETIIETGDVDRGFTQSHQSLQAVYTTPFHAHLAMEPQNCTAYVQSDQAEIWLSNQAPEIMQNAVSLATGIPATNVKVNSTYVGGGFGRRVYPDAAVEAALISQRVGMPVKLVWSREDDIQHDFYRTTTYHTIRVGLDRDGNIEAWQHTLLAPSVWSILGKSFVPATLPDYFPGWLKKSLGNGFSSLVTNSSLDPLTLDGAHIPYPTGSMQINHIPHDCGIPTGFWRSVSHSFNAYVTESFVDEAAYAAGVDPYVYRRRQLQHKKRHLRVLDLVAQKANWGEPPYEHQQGIAILETSFAESTLNAMGTIVAYVVDLTVDTKINVHRVTGAVDCGRALDPDMVKAQIEGSVVFGLSAALKDQITIKEGAVEQSNFHDTQVLRMNETPEINIHIIESEEEPTGVGEPGVPPIIAALANAVYAATGRRHRQLPIRL